KVKLRRQALDWLRADLAAWSKAVENDPPRELVGVIKTLRGWEADAVLALVRDEPGLANLPEAEQADFRTLWSGVDRLIEKSVNGVAESVPGGDPGGNASELVITAYSMYDVRHHFLSARLFELAFSRDPGLVENRQSLHRYNAACAAALAGCGQ